MAGQRRPSAPESGLVRDSAALQASAMTAAPSATISRCDPAGHRKPRSLAANVRSGAIWSFSGTILLRLSGIGITAIVARILTPHDFGVFAVATTVLSMADRAMVAISAARIGPRCWGRGGAAGVAREVICPAA